MQKYTSIKTILGLLLLLCGLYACKKEAALQPAPNPPFFTLPQGDQPYDDTILAFRDKYQSYILYKFSRYDIAYEVISTLRVDAKPANPAYIDTTLQLFNSVFIKYYPETFLQKTMPYKILLAASIDTNNAGLPGTEKLLYPSITGTFASSTTLAIGWADSNFLKKQYPRRTLREWLTYAYIKHAVLSGAMKIPDEFVKLAPPYYKEATSTPGANGLIGTTSLVFDLSIYWDFSMYACYIAGRPRTELENTILRPGYDTKGLIRQKYEVVCNFFRNEYGIDLQAIGDQP